ncbi:hypothetical protein [Oceanobacillus jordanicus]|uniref:Uncharacterized protein n=1 Tax=Oceanobacillus jordanicus TaxID=2867266 RepID=A0AAW5B2T2_9BACI|nr:hypothetical protein [Oceanobacillus jordanicus]MCG3418958.1 hypothetical protein [Oceanobacillus jordanicus]
MVIHMEVSDEGRVQGWSSTYYKGTVEQEIDESHPFFDSPMLYKLVEGELVKDDEYEQQLIEEEQEKLSKPSIEDQLSIALLEMNEKLYKLEGGG